MFCENCGKPLEDGELFCENCGQPIETSSENKENDSSKNKKRETKPSFFKSYWGVIVVIIVGVIILSTIALKVIFPEKKKSENIEANTEVDIAKEDTKKSNTEETISEEENIEEKTYQYRFFAQNKENELMIINNKGEVTNYANIASYCMHVESSAKMFYVEKDGKLYYESEGSERQLIDQNVQEVKLESSCMENVYDDVVGRILYKKNNIAYMWSEKFGTVELDSSIHLESWWGKEIISFSSNYVAFLNGEIGNEEISIISIEDNTTESITNTDENASLITIDDSGVLIYQQDEDIYCYYNGESNLIGNSKAIGGIDIFKQTYMKLEENGDLKEINYVTGEETLIESEVEDYWIVDPESNIAKEVSVYDNIQTNYGMYKLSEKYVIQKKNGVCYYKNMESDTELVELFDCNGYEVDDIYFTNNGKEIYYTIFDDEFDYKEDSKVPNETRSLYYSLYDKGKWSERELIEHNVESYIITDNGIVWYLSNDLLKRWDNESSTIVVEDVEYLLETNDRRWAIYQNKGGNTICFDVTNFENGSYIGENVYFNIIIYKNTNYVNVNDPRYNQYTYNVGNVTVFGDDIYYVINSTLYKRNIKSKTNDIIMEDCEYSVGYRWSLED